MLICTRLIVSEVVGDKEDQNSEIPSLAPLEETQDSIGLTSNEFGDKNQSCGLSSYSVLSPLTQLALAALPETHDAIITAMGLPSDELTRKVFANINNGLKSIKEAKLKHVNKIYIRDDCTLNDKFESIIKKDFKSEIEYIDFRETENAAQIINKWVADYTNGCITDFISPQCIVGKTMAILVNAIYFWGNWKKEFKKNATRDRYFHVTEENTINVQMMYQCNDFKYYSSEELDAKFLELEFDGGNTSLIVVLPNKIDGIEDLLKKIKDPVVLHHALIYMTTEEVQVFLPRFKVETTADLKSILKQMNIKTLFEEGAAKLEHIINQSKDLVLSSATQKVFIEVNEEGVMSSTENNKATVNSVYVLKPFFNSNYIKKKSSSY